MSQQIAGPAKEKKASDKDLDLSNCNRGVWLVKVPKYIADRWESVDANATVGKVKLSKRSGEKPLITLSLDDKVSFGKTQKTAWRPLTGLKTLCYFPILGQSYIYCFFVDCGRTK